MYRQGDVLIIPISQIPENAIEEKREKRIVLAYGEVTGHAHAIHKLSAKTFAANDNRYLRLAEDSLLIHEEHDPIKLPSGDYKVLIQKEYTPEEIRNVAD
jgi:hypothetical protein